MIHCANAHTLMVLLHKVAGNKLNWGEPGSFENLEDVWDWTMNRRPNWKLQAVRLGGTLLFVAQPNGKLYGAYRSDEDPLIQEMFIAQHGLPVREEDL